MPRIVYLTPNAPLPPDRGGRQRAYQLWRALSGLGETIPIVLGDASNFRARQMLRLAGGHFLPRRRYDLAKLLARGAVPDAAAAPGFWEAFPPADFPDFVWQALEDRRALNRHSMNPRRLARLRARLDALAPDLVILCDGTLGTYLEELHGRGYPLVVATHNMDSELYGALAAAAASDSQRRWARLVSAAFAQVEQGYRLADQVWVCSMPDARRFEPLVEPSRLKLVPNVVDVAAEPPPLPASRNILFIGQQGYAPNALAALELIKISRILTNRGIPHRLQLVGSPTPSLYQAASTAPDVEVVGYAADIEPYLRGAALVATPFTVGGGTRIKLLEAMAWGRPIVTTSIGIEGIEAEPGVHAIIEDDLALFPDRIAALLDRPDQAQDLAARARALVERRYSHTALSDCLAEHLGALGLAVQRQNRQPYPVFLQRRQARFNSRSGLLEISLLVATPAPIRRLDCVIRRGDESLANGTMRLTRRSSYLVMLEGCVLLTPGADPGDVAIDLTLDGAVLLSIAIDAYAEDKTALLTVEPDAGSGATVIEIRTEDPDMALEAEGVLHPLAGRGSVTSIEMPSLQRPRRLALRSAQDPGWGGSVGFDGWTTPHPASTIRLASLRNRHVGEIAWLIGNGPSVRLEDLTQLAGTLSLGFNRLHLAYPDTVFRPNYTISGDRQMIEDFGQDIVDSSAGTVFLADQKPPPLVGDYIWLRQIPTFPPVFSLDPTRAVNPGGSSLFVALQIAFFMGVRRFFIYGADFKFVYGTVKDGQDPFRSATGDGNHFIKGYRDGRPWCPPAYRHIATGFLCARHVVEQHGGWIRNASRGGLLDIFERTEFEAALQETRRTEPEARSVA